MGCMDHYVEPTYIFICFLYVLISLIYLIFSFSYVNKPILATDIIILAITSAMVHWIKGNRRKPDGAFFWISLFTSIVVMIVFFIQCIRDNDAARVEANIYTTYVTIGFGMKRSRTDTTAAYDATWLNVKGYMLAIALAIELLLLVISIGMRANVPVMDESVKQSKKALRKAEKDADRFSQFYTDSKSDKEDKSKKRVVYVMMLFFIALTLMPLLVRIGLACASTYYDMPYLTEQDSPSGIFYCGVLLLFEYMITKKKHRSNLVGILVFALLTLACIMTTWTLILDLELLHRRFATFLFPEDPYMRILVDGIDYGGWKYEIPVLNKMISATVFGKMTLASHTAIVLELILAYILTIFCALWFGWCAHKKSDEDLAEVGEKETLK